MKRLTLIAMLAATLNWGCGGKSPTSPSASPGSTPSVSGPAPGPSAGVTTGQTVNAIDGSTLAGISIQPRGQAPVVSDSAGNFRLESPQTGRLTSVVSGEGIIERHTDIMVPGQRTLSLIPSHFDLTAFDQMFRSTGRLQRWTSNPALVVQTAALAFTSASEDQFTATDDQMSDVEFDALVSDLTWSVAQLTGNRFSGFASIQRETAQPGARVNVKRNGAIVVSRYRGLEAVSGGPGLGRWAYKEDGTVVSGVIFLDRDFDRSGSQLRRAVRAHELGHGLGYNHVTNCESVMNPVVSRETTAFDRFGAAIAFQRLPGNRSPDIDPENASSIFGANAPVFWAPAIQ